MGKHATPHMGKHAPPHMGKHATPHSPPAHLSPLPTYTVITTTATATTHPSADTLHPLVHTLCTMAAARIARGGSGADVGRMRDMWVALGVSQEVVCGGGCGGVGVGGGTQVAGVKGLPLTTMVTLMGFTAQVTGG